MINTISAKSFRPAHIPLDMAIAEEFFGWRWLAYNGRPVNSHPQYPIDNIPVRRFFPPDLELHKQWKGWFAENPVHPATGDEPLAYCYCSSSGPHYVPHFSGDLGDIKTLEDEIEKRGLFDIYEGFLMAQVLKRAFDRDAEKIDHRKLRKATCEQRCMAALTAIESKYVTTPEESPA